MGKILMIGINHNDPFGREKVYDVLRKESTFIPDCIAVEWGKIVAEKLISQRKEFYELASAKYPLSTPEDLQLLSDAIAFEADAHQTLYPQLPIIWLDDKRNVSPKILATYLQDRLAIYEQYGLRNDRLIAKNVADYVYSLTEEPDHRSGGERDEIFYCEIIDALNRGHNNIICVVGATHASLDIKDSFASKLREASHNVIVYDTTQRHESI